MSIIENIKERISTLRKRIDKSAEFSNALEQVEGANFRNSTEKVIQCIKKIISKNNVNNKLLLEALLAMDGLEKFQSRIETLQKKLGLLKQ